MIQGDTKNLDEQVCDLERHVISSRTCDVDEYDLGGLLFALFSTSRWSV